MSRKNMASHFISVPLIPIINRTGSTISSPAAGQKIPASPLHQNNRHTETLKLAGKTFTWKRLQRAATASVFWQESQMIALQNETHVFAARLFSLGRRSLFDGAGALQINLSSPRRNKSMPHPLAIILRQYLLPSRILLARGTSENETRNRRHIATRGDIFCGLPRPK